VGSGGSTAADGGLGLLGMVDGSVGEAKGDASSGSSSLWEAALARAADDTKDLEWALFDLNTKAAERSWARAVSKLLDEQRAAIAKLAAEHLRPATKAAVDPDSAVEFVAALAKWTADTGERLMQRGLYPLVVSTGTAGVKRAAIQVGVTFAHLEPGLATYAKEEAEFLASVMGESTGRKVAALVQRNLNGGAALRELIADLRSSYAFSSQRAKLVARTETTRAWNGAQRRTLAEYEQASDETVRIYKEWLTAADDRVRDEHAAIHGEKARIDEAFSNGLQEPSEPNCRCTLVYSLERIGSA
jgi:SPP1 gp7 family putative phage head morphogenesis protein